VTLNIPGGSNDDKDIWYKTPMMSDEQATERTNRRAANIRWLDAAFARAKADHAKAIVIQEQADMWDLDGKGAANKPHLTEYELYINDIIANAATFTNPILLLDGDSHVYRSDNPLMQKSDDNPCFTEDTGSGTACSDDEWENHYAVGS